MNFRYGNIIGTESQIATFTKKLFIREAPAEIGARIAWVTEKVEMLLHTFPVKLNFDIVLYDDKSQVQSVYQVLYGVDFNSSGFYDPAQQKIHVAANKATLEVVSHEIAHAVLSQGYSPLMPKEIQEPLAQYVQTKIFN